MKGKITIKTNNNELSLFTVATLIKVAGTDPQRTMAVVGIMLSENIPREMLKISGRNLSTLADILGATKNAVEVFGDHVWNDLSEEKRQSITNALAEDGLLKKGA